MKLLLNVLWMFHQVKEILCLAKHVTDRYNLPFVQNGISNMRESSF